MGRSASMLPKSAYDRIGVYLGDQLIVGIMSKR